MRSTATYAFLFLCFLCFLSFDTQAESEAPEVEVTLSKNSLIPGDIFFVDVAFSPNAPNEGRLVANWNGSKIFLFSYPSENSRRQRGFAGVDVAAHPGEYPLTIIKETDHQELAKVTIKVSAGDFPTSNVRVPKRGKPDPEREKRIALERAKVAEVFGGFSPELLFDGPFEYPVSSVTVTSPFGVRRILFDGVSSTDSYHRGVDFKAAIGTPIKASNQGQVAYVGDHVLEGKFVILHHGANLFTTYLHLSEVKVKEGQVVKKGELIGHSGDSGNTRGPHLHWAAAVGGVRVNPLALFDLSK